MGLLEHPDESSVVVIADSPPDPRGEQILATFVSISWKKGGKIYFCITLVLYLRIEVLSTPVCSLEIDPNSRSIFETLARARNAPWTGPWGADFRSDTRVKASQIGDRGPDHQISQIVGPDIAFIRQGSLPRTQPHLWKPNASAMSSACREPPQPCRSPRRSSSPL